MRDAGMAFEAASGILAEVVSHRGSRGAGSVGLGIS